MVRATHRVKDRLYRRDVRAWPLSAKSQQDHLKLSLLYLHLARDARRADGAIAGDEGGPAWVASKGGALYPKGLGWGSLARTLSGRGPWSWTLLGP